MCKIVSNKLISCHIDYTKVFLYSKRIIAEFVSIYALKHLYDGYGQGIFSTGLHNKVTQSCVYRISF